MGLTGVTFTLGDVSRPDLAEHTYDVVVSRHVLWALPDPAAALTAWGRLLRAGGCLVLERVIGRRVPDSAARKRPSCSGKGDLPRITRLEDPAVLGRPD